MTEQECLFIIKRNDAYYKLMAYLNKQKKYALYNPQSPYDGDIIIWVSNNMVSAIKYGYKTKSHLDIQINLLTKLDITPYDINDKFIVTPINIDAYAFTSWKDWKTMANSINTNGKYLKKL